jgi:hypothetical protein
MFLNVYQRVSMFRRNIPILGYLPIDKPSDSRAAGTSSRDLPVQAVKRSETMPGKYVLEIYQ